MQIDFTKLTHTRMAGCDERYEKAFNRARTEQLSVCLSFADKLGLLPPVQLEQAMEFLRARVGIVDVAPSLSEKAHRDFHKRLAFRLSCVEDVLLYAIRVAWPNNGSFVQLVNDAKIEQQPIVHLVSWHRWQQLPNYGGSDEFLVVRLAEQEFLCRDVEHG